MFVVLYSVMQLALYLSVCLSLVLSLFFFFKQKTAYDMRISDWSSDVCSSDLPAAAARLLRAQARRAGGRRLHHAAGRGRRVPAVPQGAQAGGRPDRKSVV